MKFLSKSGALSAFILGTLIFGFGGLKWSIPILTFFITSSILSKIRMKKNPAVEIYFEKTGTRDYFQVLANGGAGGLLVLLNIIYPFDLFYLFYTAFLASVCADTWATEIGTLFKTQTYNIINFKMVNQGVSGGVSTPGFIGSLTGAAAIGISSIIYLNNSSQFFFITAAGFTGCLIDSYLGASVQASYICKICGRKTERIYHCENKALHNSGFTWFNNDLVNLTSGIAGGLFVVIFYLFFG